MKVTTLMPDSLIAEVTRTARGKNLTESLLIALREWLAMRKLGQLNKKIAAKPLEFSRSYSAAKVRALNRKK